ncbi:hypothetical protein [Streptomyces fragilis]|uniref:Uncharacterized protein n=1 Tax=Streptomyces fragilis TaxID=67301 RepID=A0ABV2YFK4_9ACTN|nr:hypothetical protein [Streptomyces fragilis]
MTDRERMSGMLTGLIQISHTANFEALPQLVAEHAASAGLHDAVMYLVDLQD